MVSKPIPSIYMALFVSNASAACPGREGTREHSEDALYWLTARGNPPTFDGNCAAVELYADPCDDRSELDKGQWK